MKRLFSVTRSVQLGFLMAVLVSCASTASEATLPSAFAT